jgi:hypothetical protein
MQSKAGLLVSTVIVPRSNVTVEEVSAALRSKLGAKYEITPSVKTTGFGKVVPDDRNTVLVRANWLVRTNVRILPVVNSTEIRVTPGGFVWRHLINGLGISRKVCRALEHASELVSAH